MPASSTQLSLRSEKHLSQVWRGGTRSSFRREGTDLVLRDSAGAAELVKNTVDSLYFDYAFPDSSAIGIYLSMSDGEVRTHLTTTIGMRN